MSRISVTSDTTLNLIKWTDMTPWVSAPMTRHIAVAGGRGLGKTFSLGTDNAVTTLHGRVVWSPQGQAQFDSLAGSRVTVSNGIDTRSGIVTSVTVTGTGGGAWIVFSMSVTEE